MANLASSAVVIERAWTEGGLAGKEVAVRQVTLTLTAQGSASNAIPASVLSLTKIEQAGMFIKSDNAAALPAVPSYDGSKLLLLDADNLPADATGTFRGIVKGY